MSFNWLYTRYKAANVCVLHWAQTDIAYRLYSVHYFRHSSTHNIFLRRSEAATANPAAMLRSPMMYTVWSTHYPPLVHDTVGVEGASIRIDYKAWKWLLCSRPVCGGCKMGHGQFWVGRITSQRALHWYACDVVDPNCWQESAWFWHLCLPCV